MDWFYTQYVHETAALFHGRAGSARYAPPMSMRYEYAASTVAALKPTRCFKGIYYKRQVLTARLWRVIGMRPDEADLGGSRRTPRLKNELMIQVLSAEGLR